jgi:4-hydroxymandelate oxidase
MAQAVGSNCPGIAKVVLKVMALDASAALVARTVLHCPANSDAVGVAHVLRLLRLLRDELEIAMALTGCRDLSDCTEVVDITHTRLPA